jgi:hypothetical protein
MPKHLTDQEFFTKVKFNQLLFHPELIENEASYKSFMIRDLSIGFEEFDTVFDRINHNNRLKDLMVELSPYDYLEDYMNRLKNNINPFSEFDESMYIEVENKLYNGFPLNINQIRLIAEFVPEIYDHIVFTPLEDSILHLKEVLQSEIDEYLDGFISDNLSIVRNNYLRFEKQKNAFLQILESNNKLNLYGHNFILQEEITGDGVNAKFPEFTIIQTVYALEKLGCLTVVDIWTNKVPEYYVDYEDAHLRHEMDMNQYVFINLSLKQKFIDELNEKFRTDNQGFYYEGYDKNKKILRLAGKSISLAKKGKDTNAIKLLEILLKDTNRAWNNDEITDDWGCHEGDEISKNKIYHAARGLNMNIAKITGIDDFIEYTTHEAKINQKYLKVDE